MVRKSPLDAEGALLLRQIEARTKAKSRARIAKLLAKRRGDLQRMPLSGKAALGANHGLWSYRSAALFCVRRRARLAVWQSADRQSPRGGQRIYCAAAKT